MNTSQQGSHDSGSFLQRVKLSGALLVSLSIADVVFATRHRAPKARRTDVIGPAVG